MKKKTLDNKGLYWNEYFALVTCSVLSLACFYSDFSQ